MKKIKIALGIIIAAIIAVLGYRGDLRIGASSRKPSQAVLNETFAWTFTPVTDSSGTGASTASASTSTTSMSGSTAVTLKTSKKTYAVGTFDGSCFDIRQSNWKLVPGERAGAVCWSPKGGKELGIFIKDGYLVLKAGDIDEGSIDNPGIRAHFQNLLTL